MTAPSSSNNYSVAFGTSSTSDLIPVIQSRAPTSMDIKYAQGKHWVDEVANAEYVLTSFAASAGLMTATWVTSAGGSTSLSSLTGDTGTATPSAGNIQIAGTANQIVTLGASSSVTASLSPTLVLPGTLTVAGTTLINASGSAVTTIGTGGTGAVNIGNATGNTAVTGSLTASTTLTATSGAITATNGNFVGSAAGTGFLFNSPTTSGVAASPVVVNGRSGRATFTSVSIAAGADLTLTLTNSSITATTTQIVFGWRGATTSSALSMKSVTPGSGTCAFVVTNGTGATTSTADIVIDFLVVNT